MKYRKDIQIYRGIAVILVVLFHLFPSDVPNGYLGVDIFFVISGFLMATLFHSSDTGRNGKVFLIKRFKRIYPAYIGTLLIFLLYSVFVFSPYDFYNVLIQALSGIFLVPNFYFWRTDSYFEAINFQPLLHYWSLGVEIQFYLLVPFLTLLFSKSRLWILCCFFLSFFVCIILLMVSPEASFFLVPFRIWEFMFGYFVVHFFNRKLNSSNFLYAIALCSLLYLLFSSHNFHPHPGLGALLVCVVTAFLIKFPPKTNFFKFNLFNALEKIGTYSYSLYLVHMPLIAIVWYEPINRVIHDVPLNEKLGLYLVLCFIFTYISYNIFENNKIFSFRFNKGTVFYCFLLPSLLLVLVTGYALNTHIKGERLKSISFAKEDTLPWRCGKVFKVESIFTGEKSCLLAGEEQYENRILVVGDSHADSLKYGVIQAAEGSDSSVYLYKDNCVPGRRSCTLDNLIAEIYDKKISKLVVHGLHYRVNYKELINLSNRLNDSVDLFFVKPVPVFSLDEHIPRYLYNQPSAESEVYLSNSSEIISQYEKYADKYLEIKEAGYKLVETIDVFCREKCIVQKENVPLYFDNHHLTNTGSLMLKKRLFTDVIND